MHAYIHTFSAVKRLIASKIASTFFDVIYVLNVCNLCTMYIMYICYICTHMHVYIFQIKSLEIKSIYNINYMNINIDVKYS